MGDADIQQLIGEETDPTEWVREVLDDVDRDLDGLFEAVNDLDERLEAVSVQTKHYPEIRNFFLAMNFFVIPVVFAIGLCYNARELLMNDSIKSFMDVMVTIMMSVSVSVGFPLYLLTLYHAFAEDEQLCEVVESKEKQSFSDYFKDDEEDIDDNAPEEEYSESSDDSETESTLENHRWPVPNPEERKRINSLNNLLTRSHYALHRHNEELDSSHFIRIYPGDTEAVELATQTPETYNKEISQTEENSNESKTVEVPRDLELQIEIHAEPDNDCTIEKIDLSLSEDTIKKLINESVCNDHLITKVSIHENIEF